jgi:hypothetical protein
MSALVLFVLAGCGETVDRSAGVAEYEDFPDQTVPLDELPAGEQEPVFGFHGRQRLEVYDLGRVLAVDGEIPIHSMYVFYDEAGNLLGDLDEDGKKSEGQAPIVDTLPDRVGYSPFFEIVRVTVPGGYRENEVKSLATLRDRAYATDRTGIVVNCPIVSYDRELADGVTSRGVPFPKIALWFDRLQAYCLSLDGAWQTMETLTGGFTAPIVPQEVIYPVVDLFGDVDPVDPETGLRTDLVLATGDLLGNRILPAIPGSGAYSPLASIRYLPVPGDYRYGDYAETADVDPADLLPADDPPQYRNLSYRGTVPACDTDDDCGTGLSCNLEFGIREPTDPANPGFCDTPPAGYGQECGPGIARCDSFGGPIGGPPGQIPDLICIRIRTSQTRFCYNSCDADVDDTDEAEDRDSRCGSIKDYVCFGLTRPRPPDGLCIKRCNALATTTLEEQCRPLGPYTEPPVPENDQSCGNGQWDIGEACDRTCVDASCTSAPPEKRWDESTCNEDCTISTLGADPPVTAAPDEHPLSCQLDLCFFPDDRAPEEP